MANDPTTPSSYTAGTITLAVGINNLWLLIQSQVDPHVTGCATEFTIQTDASGDVYVGQSNKIGALSTTNYGYLLVAGGQSRTYRSGGGVERAPLPSIQIYSAAGGTLNVEVVA